MGKKAGGKKREVEGTSQRFRGSLSQTKGTLNVGGNVNPTKKTEGEKRHNLGGIDNEKKREAKEPRGGYRDGGIEKFGGRNYSL